MKKSLAAVVLVISGSFAALPAAASMPKGDLAAGQALAGTCAACHGADGNSPSPAFPKIAGQHAKYTYQQLQAYKSGARNNALMAGIAAGLSDQDMANLAAYFAQQKPTGGAADPELAVIGERIYRGGDSSKGLTSCAGCHGPAGKGNSFAGYPRIAGQHADYTRTQLRAYRAAGRDDMVDEKRLTGGIGTELGPMQMIAAKLSDKEIEALSSYIQGLR
jgi:cytochrome c553